MFACTVRRNKIDEKFLENLYVKVNVEWYKAKRELSYLLPAIGWYEGWGAKLDMECPESMWQRARELTETLEQESKDDDREDLNP